MTRINTNINSLTAQQNLAKTGVQLSQALTRLSTGLRINSGKDDPAGMIAAAQLGSDIAGTNAAISNSKMGEMILDTADSALGQITSLVNDIRTLVTQAANSAAMSPDQIAANQLQIDSSLDAIDRIANSTNFQGRKLLDGSLDFTTVHNLDTAVSHYDAVQNLEIDSADMGLASTLPVTVSVSQQAQKAYLATTTPTTTTGGYLITTANGSFTIQQPTTNPDNYDFTNMNIVFASDSSVLSTIPKANYETSTNTLTISVNNNTATDMTSLATALGVATITTTSNGVVTPKVTAPTTLAFTISSSQVGTTYDPLKDATPVSTMTLSSANVTGAAGSISLKFTANSSAPVGKNLNVTVNTVNGATTSNVVFDANGNTTITLGTSDTETVQNLLDTFNAATGGTMTASINAGSSSNTIISQLGAGAATKVSAASGRVATSSSVAAASSQVIMELKDHGAIQVTSKTGGAASNVNIYLARGAGTKTDTTAAMVSAHDLVVTIGTSASNTQLSTEDIASAITAGTDFAAVSIKHGVANTTTLTGDVDEYGSLDVTNNAGATKFFTVTGKVPGQLDYTTTLTVTNDAAAPVVSYTGNNLTVKVGKNATATVGDVINAINNLNGPMTASLTTAGPLATAAISTIGLTNTSDNGVLDAGKSATWGGARVSTLGTYATSSIMLTGTKTMGLDFTSTAMGAAGNGKTISYTVTAGAGVSTAAADAAGNLTVAIFNGDTATVETLIGLINGLAGGASKVTLDNASTAVLSDKLSAVISTPAAAPPALVNAGGSDSVTAGADALNETPPTLSAGGTVLAEDIKFMGTGSDGSHLFEFTRGTSLALVKDGINSWSDGTGISARLATSGAQTQLILESTMWGSHGTLGLQVYNGDHFKNNMVDRYGTNTLNASGTDIQAKVNGVTASGDGNKLSINTPALAMSMTVNEPTTAAPTPATISFTISGGGAQFQIGPNVVSTQKAIIGIQNVSTSNMNTIYGRLSELHKGQDADLTDNTSQTRAGKIITAVAGQIATLRGRLGSFSKTTMETNIQTLSSTVNALTNAQSTIQDADFAAETAALTRAQVLTQSGTSVLSIANRGPQNVLALLQNL